jgi:peroxiredoxin family protein
MKVKELIEELQKHDPERELKVAAEGMCWDLIDILDEDEYVVIESNDY